jgi:hypothetical protein
MNTDEEHDDDPDWLDQFQEAEVEKEIIEYMGNYLRKVADEIFTDFCADPYRLITTYKTAADLINRDKPLFIDWANRALTSLVHEKIGTAGLCATGYVIYKWAERIADDPPMFPGFHKWFWEYRKKYIAGLDKRWRDRLTDLIEGY